MADRKRSDAQGIESEQHTRGCGTYVERCRHPMHKQLPVGAELKKSLMVADIVEAT